MSEINIVRDAAFLKRLDLENVKTYYTKIIVLRNDEVPIREVQGRTISGSISINGDSSVRRSGSISLIADENENDLTDIDNLFSINKKIQILIGIKNFIDDNYDNIIWFKQGIFLVTQPSVSHSASGATINLQFKDKMCLLDGEISGNLPASVTFDSYDQEIGYLEVDSLPSQPKSTYVYGYKKDGTITYYMWDATDGWDTVSKSLVGTTVNVKQKFFDIIQTAVCNYGGESIDRIIINDVALELKQSVRNVSSDELYYNTTTGVYTYDSSQATDSNWISFKYNQDCGYEYTDFTYPGELVSSIGDNVCSILDKIVSQLGNYEYFYDVNGNFIFQEKKNYLNNSYDPIITLDQNGFLLNNDNYYVDFSNSRESVYTFEEGSGLISSYSNSPSYINVKNDFHIWGKNEDGYATHYHVAVKSKPNIFNTYKVKYNQDVNGNYTGTLYLDNDGYDYTPADWRAELYMEGLYKKSLQQRPDIYEQELLDLWDSIYNMKDKCFKVDIVNNVNDLKYWFDYIEPWNELQDVSVDAVGTKIYSYQQDNIKKLYNTDIPDRIMINLGSTATQRISIARKCQESGQPFSNVDANIYSNVAIGTIGYVAQEIARDLMYQYVQYNASISISSIPIYYLEPNTRITVYDRVSGINGDYIINSINLPLNGQSMMTIKATKILPRL